MDQKSTRTMTSEPVMFQGKWIETDDGGTWWVADELIEEIQNSPPVSMECTLFGKPVIIENNQDHPGNCHNGVRYAETIPYRDPVKYPERCPMTCAVLAEQGLTRNGACPTIRNPRKAKS